MQVKINGEDKKIVGKTIQEVLEELKITEKVMAAAVNMNVVKKEQWSSYELKEGDKVEFLQFVGGG